MNILPTEGIKPISDFRKDSAHLLKQLKEKHQPILLTQRGRSVAVLLDVETYEQMEYASYLRASYLRGVEDIKLNKKHRHADVVRDARERLKNLEASS